VFFLRPRVGAEEVDTTGESRGQEPIHRVVRVGPEEPHIFQSGADRFAAHLADPAKEPLDSEKVPFGEMLCHADEKGAVAAAEIEFDGVSTGKEIPAPESGEPLVGVDFVGKGKGFDLWHRGDS
jgi:hypothetical protein